MSASGTSRSSSLAGDRGDVVLGWLTKVVVSLSLLGLLGFDAMSLGAARFQAEDHAQQAARVAAEAFSQSKDLQAAYDAALDEVLDRGDTIDPASFTVAPDGTVTLTLTHETTTLLVEKIPPLRKHTIVRRTVTGRPLS